MSLFGTYRTVDVFIDGVRGSDVVVPDGQGSERFATPPGDPRRPFRSVSGALRSGLYSGDACNGTRLIFHFAANGTSPQTYNLDRSILLGGGETLMPSMQFRGPQMVRATPTTGPASASLDVTPATVVTLTNCNGLAFNARTRLNFVTANPGWTTDDFSGRYFVRISSYYNGTPKTFELPISGNTSNQIFVDDPSLASVIASNDVVEICTPGAILAGDVFDSYNAYPSETGSNGLLFIGGSGSAFALSTGDTNDGAAFERLGLPFLNANCSAVLSFDRCAFQTARLVAGACHFVNCCVGSRTAVPTGAATTPGSLVIVSTHALNTGPSSRPDLVGVPINTGPSVALAAYNAHVQIGGGNGEPFPGNGAMYFNRAVGIWSGTGGSGAGSFTAVGPGTWVYFANGASLIGTTAAAGPGLVARAASQVRLDANSTALTGNAVGSDLALETGATIPLANLITVYAGNFYLGNSASGDASRIYTT